jgi:hypothetical protein
MIDEGASTSHMFMSCWKALGSPKLDTSTTLLKAFDANMFHAHGIIITLLIKLSGKIVFVAVEVIDEPVEYNLLLGHTWLYEMIAFDSSVFRVLRFPHQGKVVTTHQLVFCTSEFGSNARSNVPFVNDTQQSHMSVDAGMFKYPSLMGICHLPPPPPATNILLST